MIEETKLVQIILQEEINMYYIADYLDYYKNTDVETIKWNIMDNLICTILVYLPVEGFKEEKNLNSFCTYVEPYAGKKYEGNMVPLAFDVLKKISGSTRYNDMIISDFTNDRSTLAQFGAMTVRIGENTVIVYKGTDHSVIGWIENFRISYDYPTCTQKLAIEYMKRNIRCFGDKNIYVTGHSKGGNLAIVSAMEMGNRIFHRIKKVYNFDGPGLRKEEYLSEKYERLCKKLVNIIPEGSIVGMVLYNRDYHVVETSPGSINDHYPNTWGIFGEFFQPSRLSVFSKKIHENIINSMEKFPHSQVEQAFEAIFQNIEQDYTSDFNLSPETILPFIKNMREVDKEIADDIYEIMKQLLWQNSKV